MGIEAMRMHAYPEFQTWLAREVEVRDELEELMGFELGFDTASLDPLEAFLLERYPNMEAALTLDQRPVLDAAARHVGLILTFSIDGARWDINLDDDKNVFYRLPVIRFPDDSTDAPVTAVTVALDRRTGHVLRDYVEANAELYGDDA